MHFIFSFSPSPLLRSNSLFAVHFPLPPPPFLTAEKEEGGDRYIVMESCRSGRSIFAMLPKIKVKVFRGLQLDAVQSADRRARARGSLLGGDSPFSWLSSEAGERRRQERERERERVRRDDAPLPEEEKRQLDG